MTNIAIRVEGLGKQYRIGGPQASYRTIRESVVEAVQAPFRRLASVVRGQSTVASNEIIWALKDVSFEVQRGEVVGIIGRNGAGKTTLLKILSRITEPTEGYAEIHGRVGSLLEVGTGFHPELTGRENVYLNGAILGMKRAEIDRKFDEIVAFAEVEKFIDTPVKHYSSGMYVRLAFAVAAHLEPEILLVDEVLAVGDAAFQKKCLGKMRVVAGEGRTVLFVSHSMQAIKSLCDRCILLKQGSVCVEGPAPQVADRYIAQSLGTPVTSIAFPEDPTLRVQLLHAELVPQIPVQGREEILFKSKYIVRKELEDMLLCVEVRNTSDVSVFYSNDGFLKDSRKRKVGTHTVTLSIPMHLLAPGEYLVAFGFWRPGHSAEHFPDVRLVFRRKEPITPLSSHGISWPSVIYMPTTWNYVESRRYFTEEDVL
jgi:ABC-type polysaccharide/polyol phosphate transport system ATPase subunit